MKTPRSAPTRKVLWSALAAGLACALPAQATLVSNGSFELTSPAVASPTVMNASGFSLTGWTHNTAPGIDGDCLVAPGYSGSICGGVGLAGALPANSPDGGNFIASDGNFFNHSISQLITGLTPSASYQLTFYQALAQDVEPGITVPGPVSGHWDVTFGSTTLSSAAMAGNGATSTFAPWSLQTMTFIASNSSELLSFLSVGAGDPPIVMLDGVELSAIPEPETLGLLALGSLLLTLKRGHERWQARRAAR